ncbi:MAG: amidase [Candidatus Eremiobacterota bacterium]
MVISEKSITSSEICFMTATEMIGHIRNKELSAQEVMEAHLLQIEQLNPRLNAIVTLAGEEALKQARDADRGKVTGPLHGIPVAHKDLLETVAIKTTYGSLAYKDNIPDFDCIPVERIKKAGAITIGKTNTSEFGAGSQTFNSVFGKTFNPYDMTKTCGGSSGGSAVALACGMVPLATGTDAAGSLRNPASFCNVVGMRTSPGRIPIWPVSDGWNSFSVAGPMARTVSDIALLLSVMAGPDSRSPISIQEEGHMFSRSLKRNFKGVNIAWAIDLGGLPFEPEVKKIVDSQKKVFQSLGCKVEDSEPDFTGADKAYKAWRAWDYELILGENLKKNKFKYTLLKNIEEGERITGPQLASAERIRTELYHRIRLFMEKYEFFILPVSQVIPFDINQEYVKEIQGVNMLTYIDWQKTCYYISLAGNPAIAVPCGFTEEGLPVGLQIVGRHKDELGLLQIASAFEDETKFYKRRPPVVDTIERREDT